MANLPIPPTYAEPVVTDQEGKTHFNPVWLRWFIEYAAALSTAMSIVESISLTSAPFVGTEQGSDEGGDAEAISVPGPVGPVGPQGPAAPMWVSEEIEGEQGVPGAQGNIGPVGPAGPLLFLEPDSGDEPLLMLAPEKYRTATTPTRALNTTYTNTSTQTLLVHATVRCAITLAGGNAHVQALMDTATPPTTPATGLVGIQAGLVNEDNSFQIVFLVNPGGTYYLQSSATNGTVTLGTWFEFSL